MKFLSVHAFAKAHDLPKTTVWNRAKDLGIDTSKGLSPTDQEVLKADFRIVEEPTQETALVPVHHAELVPCDSQELLHFGNGTTVNIVIHTGQADAYSAEAANTHANVQAALQALFDADAAQGEQDALEIQAARKAIKEKRLEKVLGGHVRAAGNDAA